MGKRTAKGRVWKKMDASVIGSAMDEQSTYVSQDALYGTADAAESERGDGRAPATSLQASRSFFIIDKSRMVGERDTVEDARVVYLPESEFQRVCACTDTASSPVFTPAISNKRTIIDYRAWGHMMVCIAAHVRLSKAQRCALYIAGLALAHAVHWLTAGAVPQPMQLSSWSGRCVQEHDGRVPTLPLNGRLLLCLYSPGAELLHGQSFSLLIPIYLHGVYLVYTSEYSTSERMLEAFIIVTYCIYTMNCV